MVMAASKDRCWLAGNSYPGRGLVVGRTADGAASVQLYWVMGRSQDSRNRRLARAPDGSVRVTVADAAAGVARGDPSLLLYRALCAVRHGDGSVTHVVGNGDQTDTIAAGLAGGESFIAAFSRRAVEPDAPHYTARIAGAVTVGGSGGEPSCELAIVKAVGGGEPPRDQLPALLLPRRAPRLGVLHHHLRRRRRAAAAVRRRAVCAAGGRRAAPRRGRAVGSARPRQPGSRGRQVHRPRRRRGADRGDQPPPRRRRGRRVMGEAGRWPRCAGDALINGNRGRGGSA